MKFTIIIEESTDGWYVGQLEELPAAMSQGKTIEECKTNVLDAMYELFHTNRELVEAEYRGKKFIKELVEVGERREKNLLSILKGTDVFYYERGQIILIYQNSKKQKADRGRKTYGVVRFIVSKNLQTIRNPI